MKIVRGVGWVRVRNMLNRRFKAAAPCSICRTAKCGMVWYNVTSGEVRCLRCYEPPETVDRAWLARQTVRRVQS